MIPTEELNPDSTENTKKVMDNEKALDDVLAKILKHIKSLSKEQRQEDVLFVQVINDLKGNSPTEPNIKNVIKSKFNEYKILVKDIK